MGAIELRGITIAHGDAEVLRDLDLVVGDGEVVALLGRSGCGKTSLLRVVAGFDPLVSGQVVVGGRDITSLPSRDRDMGMVAQGAPLHPTRDVEGNLMLPLELRGDDREESRSRAVGEALRFGLSRLLGRRPRQLSTGERAATATARSVMRAPSALLLDEPATHLDHQTRARVLQQIGIIQRTRGTTMLVATNTLDVASALADRIAVIDERTIAQVAPLATLRESPVSLDVADLVHHAPLHRLPGRVVPGRAGSPGRVATAAGELPTWDTRVRGHAGEVLLGLAQHHVELVPTGGGHLTGQVARTVTTGARRLVTVQTPAGPVLVETDAPAGDIPEPGTAVGVVVHRALVATTAGQVLAAVQRP